MKRPSFQFYPADWRKDIELRSCSVAARGLWIDLMCLAHECEPYGHLTVNSKAMTAAQIAGQIGLSAPQCAKLLAELIENGVARKTPEGVIFSKRMVDDERIRNARAEGGKAGSEHGSKGAEHGSKGGRPRKETGDKEPPSEAGRKPPLEPPPSSSSSSSSSDERRGRAANPAKPDDVSEQTWDDWCALRKAKKAPVTTTVIEAAQDEARKASMPLERFLTVWCMRGSQGLQADWLKPEERAANGKPVSQLDAMFARGSR